MNKLTLFCNMQLNVLNDLAEAMKALDGKKSPVLCCLRLLPLAAAGLRLLSPFSSLFTLRLSWPATQSFSEVVFFDLLFWPLVVVCLVLSGLSSCFVGVFCCCACCQPTEVTKDCRVLPAPSVHTHTHTRHRDFLPPLAYLLEVGLFLNSFVFFCLSWLSCDLVPLARLSSSVREVGNSRPEPWTRLHCSE